MKDKLRVLSLDGGGIRGYLSAKLLSNLEYSLNSTSQNNINIGQRFDLIVGTSTGGIIAAGLAKGISAKKIFEAYEKLLPLVFEPQSKGVLKSKYSSEVLRKELNKILGDAKLSDVHTHLCLTSVDVENGSPRFHKSGYFERNLPRQDEALVDLVLASSAAPTFFPLVNTLHSSNLADGGMVANNPSLIGLIDAMELMGNDLNKIALISIGTGDSSHLPYDLDSVADAGKYQWMAQPAFKFKIPTSSPIIELLMESQSKLAHFQTQFLLKDNYLRINPTLSTSIALDDFEKIDSLKNLADIEHKDFEKVQTLLL